jgi:hypothetical protein
MMEHGRNSGTERNFDRTTGFERLEFLCQKCSSGELKSEIVDPDFLVDEI